MYDIFLLPLIAIYSFVLLALVTSIVLPLRKLKGAGQVAVILLVLVFWGVVYWKNLGGGSDFAERDWRVASRNVCEKETASFPHWFRIDSFVDEATIIRTQSVLLLLSERGLKFVEIRVGKNQSSKGFIAFGDSQGDGYWETGVAEGSYARLELGKKGDVSCTELPSHVKGHESELPFLPDTCIKVTYSNKATSRYALELTPSHYSTWSSARKYGAWTLTDREKNQQLATVTTSDTSTFRPVGFVTDLLNIDPIRGPSQDCRTASNAIINRILAPELPRGDYPQLLRLDKEITSNTPLFDANNSAIPKVSTVEQGVKYSDKDIDLLFGSENSHALWIKAIDQAKNSGWGNFGHYLIDWKERVIRTLQPPKWWMVQAVNDGFIAYSFSAQSWSAEGGLILRYASNGKLDWSARVLPPKSPSGKCNRFEPRAIYTEGTDLILADKCGEGDIGAKWLIRIRDLPGKL
ncbi:hypothetical protein [uncultured Tolumonas sp.]|uniref:hypothetical protein n=1 Tax=uncultured Tolumonas sp. TaxID=263765 RepID=UPI00292D80B1|nr:hypothetical protein [uncultured Tolumonas sp.]